VQTTHAVAGLGCPAACMQMAIQIFFLKGKKDLFFNKKIFFGSVKDARIQEVQTRARRCTVDDAVHGESVREYASFPLSQQLRSSGRRYGFRPS